MVDPDVVDVYIKTLNHWKILCKTQKGTYWKTKEY